MRSTDGSWERKFNLSQAEKFGKIVPLASSTQSMVSAVPLVRRLNEIMRDFDDDDYLLMLGDPSIMAAAAAIASARNGGRFKLLKWDRLMRDYIPVQIDISGKAL